MANEGRRANKRKEGREEGYKEKSGNRKKEKEAAIVKVGK